MATTLSNIQLSAVLRATLTDTLETVPRTANSGEGSSLAFTNGTTSGKADRKFQDLARNLTSGNSESLDLFDLAVFDLTTDVIGNTVTFADIVGLLIKNLSTSTGNLVIGGEGDSTAWTSLLAVNTYTLTLPPDGHISIGCRSDPAWAVADTTNHVLKVAASGGDCDFSIVILGRSA